jgi:hypothetical protein
MKLQNLPKRLLHNWQAKLASLAVGFVLWLMLKISIEPELLDQTLGPWRP